MIRFFFLFSKKEMKIEERKLSTICRFTKFFPNVEEFFDFEQR
jgi:hypothetical protein